MKRWIHRLIRLSRSQRKGAATVEFTIILPLFIMMALVVWQFAVSGLAILDTQAALRDAVRVASTSGDPSKGEEAGRSSFGSSSYYQLSDFQVYFQNDKAYAKATTKIDILFMSGMPFTFEDQVEAPIID